MTLVVAGLHASASQAEVLRIPAAFWVQPRHGETVIKLAGLSEQVLLLGQRESTLVIRHGGGEDNVLRATELAAWMTALGVSSAQIRIELGAADASQLELELEQGR